MRKAGFGHRMRSLWQGYTLLRILMDERLAAETIRGKVLDVGGGRHQTYFEYLKREGEPIIEATDGSISGIDFETDSFPYADASIDTVICCNVLEHIYNHRHLLDEMHRILAPGGQLIGFVPFLFNYHPDPQDYFRYTGTALVRLLTDAGFSAPSAHEIGGGPFLLNFNTLAPTLPRLMRACLFPFYAALDAIFLRLRPQAYKRYPLGYVFLAGE